MFEARPDRSAEVVLCGRSNVGKSTLMRHFTGHAVPTGSRPGVTQSPNYFDWTSEDFLLTDLPGFGFMSGVEEDRREEIKTEVVQYLDRVADRILVAVLVVDGKSVVDIIDRHTKRGEVPHDVELFQLLSSDLGLPTVVAVNKMDKVDDRDDRLDALCDRLGMPPPWQQWDDVIAPISASREQIEPLEQTIHDRLHEAGRDDLKQFF